MEYAPPPKLWTPARPAIIRAASMEDVARMERKANVVPGMFPAGAIAGGLLLISVGGTASASSDVGGLVAANAFDNNNSLAWVSSVVPSSTPQVLKYQLPAARVAKRYSILAWSSATSGSAFNDRAPKTWTFDGSPNDSTWTTLDTQTGVAAWGDGEMRTYNFVNTTAYLYYRIRITAEQTNPNFCCVTDTYWYGV